MPEPEIVVRTYSVHRGMDDRSPPWIVADEQATLLENLEASRPGKRTRARGTSSIGAASASTSFAVGGVWRFYDKPLLQDTIMGIWHNKLTIVVGNGALADKACGASFVDGLHMASRGYWRGLDTTYISSAQVNDSGGSLMSRLTAIDLDGSFSQAASFAPRCTMWWQGRLWMADNVLNQDYDTLWWSSLNDGLSFSAINTIRVESGRGGRITALHPVRSGSPQFLVWKERMVSLVSPYWGSSSSLIPQASDALDTIQSSINTVSNDAGCVATKSLQPITGSSVGDFIFLSHDGFRTISRSTDDVISGVSLPISASIQSTIDRINFAHAQKAVSAVWDTAYHCAVPLDGATENTHILSFDLLGNGWYLNTLDAKDLVTTRLTGTQDNLYLQSNVYSQDTTPTNSGTFFAGAHVFRTFTGDVFPGGQAVPFREESKAYTFGSVDQKKRWSWFSLHAYNQNATCVIDVACKIDNDSAVSVGQIVLPPAGGTTIILGSTQLPWHAVPNGIHMRKLGLEDLTPGYMIQMILTQTGPSDFGRPTIVQTAIGARPVAAEFDNEIT